MASYTAQQMYQLLDRLRGDTQKRLNTHPRVWETVAIRAELHPLDITGFGRLMRSTYTVEVDAPDGSGWFVCAVWRLEGVTQTEFDGDFNHFELYGFSQHDGDGGNAGPDLEEWYHAMCLKEVRDVG